MTELIGLDDYDAPSMPTEHALRKKWSLLRRKLGAGADDDPLLTQDALERTALDELDGFAPAAIARHQVLDNEMRDWANQRSADSWTKLLVLPPCDGASGIVEAWASAAGHQLLAPPQRDRLTADAAAAVSITGSRHDVLVIPRLEHWFLRHRNGLEPLRQLLARLADLERHCVVACNSWAWRFIVAAAGADILLPRPCTLQRFDAARLRDWFAATPDGDANRPVSFRLARTGEDVLATDEDGELKSSHLQQLAAHSFGIPWVAAELWRASLSHRTGSDDLPERALKATSDDARTIWVADVEDPRLPPGHEDCSLLALHALLIHEAMTADQLDGVLPSTGETDVLPALLAAGFVQRDAQRRFRVRAIAYPAVRRALLAAGVPAGRM